MSLVVHPDQTGFIVGREAQDNSIGSIQLIHWTYARQGPMPYMIPSMDAEKVFKRVDRIYFKVVLEALGVGPNMLTWIMALYSTPSAMVKVNGLFSSGFPIRNDMRQGCPL